MTTLLASLGRLANGSSLRRNISVTLARQLLAAVAQLLSVVLIARNLGPVGNGQYAMAILLPTLLVNFLNLGVGPATVYHVSRGEFSARQAATENLRLGLMVVALGVIFAVPVVLLWGGQLFPGVPLPLLLTGLAAFPVSLLLAYLSTIFQGLEDFRSFNTTVLLPPYVTLVGVWLSLYLLQTGPLGAVTAYLIGQTAGLAIVTMYILRRTPKRMGEPAPVSVNRYRRKTIGYGWKAHLSNIMAFVNYRADIFLVNFFLNPAATGLYVVVVQIAERLWILSQAASTVLLPRLSGMHDDPTARLALTRKSFLTVSTITAVAGILATTALYWLLGPIFGQEYEQAFPAFLVLLPGIIAGAGARVQSNCIAAAGKPEWNMYIAIMVVVMNVLGNILLVPEYGIIGAAWATTGAYIANAIAKQYLVGKCSQIV